MILHSDADAAAAAAIGAKVIYFGTDYLFDGTAGPYSEDAPPGPLNHYGASKLQGEALVRAAAPGALILRTTGVCRRTPDPVSSLLLLLPSTDTPLLQWPRASVLHF